MLAIDARALRYSLEGIGRFPKSEPHRINAGAIVDGSSDIRHQIAGTRVARGHSRRALRRARAGHVGSRQRAELDEGSSRRSAEVRSHNGHGATAGYGSGPRGYAGDRGEDLIGIHIPWNIRAGDSGEADS